MTKNTLLWNGHAARRADGSSEEYVNHVLDDARLLIARVPANAIGNNQAVELVVTPVRGPSTTNTKAALGTYRIEAHGNVAKLLLQLRPFWERCGVSNVNHVHLWYRTYPASANPIPDSTLEGGTWKLWPAAGQPLEVEDQAVDADDHGASVGRKPKRKAHPGEVAIEVCVVRTN